MTPNPISRLYRTAAVAALLPGQRRVAYLPPAEVARKRDARLRRIVRYAARTVPYYRDLFRREAIDPVDIRAAADMDRLPLLDKATIRANPDAFVSRSRPGRGSIEFTTSGSTGEPLKIHHDIGSLIANFAYCEPERDVVRHIIRRGGPLREGTRQAAILYGKSTARKIWKAYRRYSFIPPPSGHLVLGVEDSVDDLIAAINAFRPHMINGYGSHLEALYRTVADRGLEMHRPRLISYGADAMTEPGRQFIEEHFGVPVVSRYGAVEALRIGFTCEEAHGFHIRPDLYDVKIVGADGRRVPDKQRGEVVISNLVNHGTVLLNFRLGDSGAITTDPCACGRNLPLLTDLDGRVEDVILLSDGNFVHPRAVWAVFKERPDVLRYQLIQHEWTHFELKLVTRDRHTYDRVIGEVESSLRRLLGPVRLDADHYDELETMAAGKFRPVISHCDPKATP